MSEDDDDDSRLPPDRYLPTGELLGEGGMGRVWRVWHRSRGSWCAIKILRRKFVEQAPARRRFINESRTLMKLDHRNVIAAWEVGEGEHPYLVMEVADGGTLKDWIIRYGPMPPRMAVGVAIQICKGLRAAHEIGVIHRDVKPHNVLVNRKGVCKVSDFGIARIPREDGGEDVPDATTAQATDAMGTMGYMAPEQRSDPRRADPRTDVYGIGSTLYDLLTGRPSSNLFMADKEPDLLEDVSELLRPVLIHAVKYRPEDRFGAVYELAKELHAVRSLLAEDPSGTPELAAGLPPEPAPPAGYERTPLSEAKLDDLEVPTTVPRRGIHPISGGSGSSTDSLASRDTTPHPRPPLLRPETRRTPTSESESPIPWPPPAVRSPPVGTSTTPKSRGSVDSRSRDARIKPRRAAPARISDPDQMVRPRERTRVWVVAFSAWIFLLGLLGFDAWWAKSYAGAALKAIDAFKDQVFANGAIIDQLADLKADKAELEQAQTAVGRAQDPVQVVLTGRSYVRVLQNAEQQHTHAPYDRAQTEVVTKVTSLQNAMLRVDAALDAWRDVATTFPGSIAVRLRLAPAPPPVSVLPPPSPR